MDVFGNRSMVCNLFVCVYKAHFQILKILAVHMKNFKGERTLIMEKEALGNCKDFVQLSHYSVLLLSICLLF